MEEILHQLIGSLSQYLQVLNLKGVLKTCVCLSLLFTDSIPWDSSPLNSPPEQSHLSATVDGWNPANQLRLVVYPIIYYGFQHHPRWLARFQPSTSYHQFCMNWNQGLTASISVSLGCLWCGRWVRFIRSDAGSDDRRVGRDHSWIN